MKGGCKSFLDDLIYRVGRMVEYSKRQEAMA